LAAMDPFLPVEQEKLRVSTLALEAHRLRTLQIYTDGGVSASGVGVGAYILHHQQQGSIQTGHLSYSFLPEAEAIRLSLRAIRAFRGYEDIVIYSDSQSALSALASGPLHQTHTALAETWQLLHQMFLNVPTLRSVHFQFVYAHCGVPGNEAVDRVCSTEIRNIESRITPIRSPPAPMDLISIRLATRRYLQSTWMTTIAALTEPRPFRFPRLIPRHDRISSSPAKSLDHLSRLDATMVRQLRVGEISGMGTFLSRLLPEPLHCRWCQQADAVESVFHLFNHCLAAEVSQLRLSTAPTPAVVEAIPIDVPPGANPAPLVCFDTLFSDPACALTFFRSCMLLLPPLHAPLPWFPNQVPPPIPPVPPDPQHAPPPPPVIIIPAPIPLQDAAGGDENNMVPVPDPLLPLGSPESTTVSLRSFTPSPLPLGSPESSTVSDLSAPPSPF
jgi:ribonuclease HI